MSDLAAVINRHIGRPWSAQGFDCWAFVRAIYAEAYALQLPCLPGVDGADYRAAARAVAAGHLAGDWLPVDLPRNGDVALMSKRDRPHHCGIWLWAAGSRIAHCEQVGGVRCLDLRQLRALGWGSITYYRHRLRP